MIFLISTVFIAILYLSFRCADKAYLSLRRLNVSPDDRLFYGNTIILTTLSNVGSIFSLALLSTLVALSFKLGRWTIPFLLISLSWAYIVYSLFVKNLPSSYKNLTLIHFISNQYDTKLSSILSVLLIYFLWLSITIEISIFHRFIDDFFFDSNVFARFFSFLVLFICMAYVYRGSFLGVLKTDTLQIGVILIASFIIIMIISVCYHCTLFNLSSVSQFSLYSMKYVMPHLTINNFFQLIFLFFAISMWVFVMPDFWIRNIGTLSDSRTPLRNSLIGIFIFGSIIIAFSIFLKNTFEWNSTLDAPFYHLNKFINILLTLSDPRYPNISDSELNFINCLETPLLRYLMIISCFSILCLVILTTIDTLFITCAQLIHAIPLINRHLNAYRFILLSAIIASIHTLFLPKNFFTGWGTLWASMFLYLASVVCLLLFLRPKNCNSNILAYSLVLSGIFFLFTILISWNKFYFLYISMHSLLCFIYVTVFPFTLIISSCLVFFKKRG